MSENFGKGVLSKIKNQQTEFEKDETEILWKIFSRGQCNKPINRKQWNETFLAWST